MSLKDDKQQNIQMELDFSSALTGELFSTKNEANGGPIRAVVIADIP